MGSVSVKLHREFSTRAPRGMIGPSGRPLREMKSLVEDRERQSLGARAAAGVRRALPILFELMLWIGCFYAGALAFAYLMQRW
jgi:hypothetical protein